jgi:hypothetical protein
MIQCKNFEINCGNSDAECFAWLECDDNTLVLLSKINLINNPHICNVCVYNIKFENLTYEQFEELKLRRKKLERIMK